MFELPPEHAFPLSVIDTTCESEAVSVMHSIHDRLVLTAAATNVPITQLSIVLRRIFSIERSPSLARQLPLMAQCFIDLQQEFTQINYDIDDYAETLRMVSSERHEDYSRRFPD